MSRGPVLVTGGGGQLATDLVAALGSTDTVVAPSRAELDISDDAALAATLERLDPKLVLNCAAFHHFDSCERDPARAFEVNAVAVTALARACAERGAKLVHLSTNYVFDGDAERPYGEDDATGPRSIYAISKLAGEHAAISYAPGALVVRTAGLYGRSGNASKGGSFVTRMLARARDGEPIRMVADQRLTPTYTADLAAALLEAVDAGTDGILHLTNDGDCSWFEFTEAIMELAGQEVDLSQAETETRPGDPGRPLNGVLARPRADALGLTPLRPWRDALADYLAAAELAGAQAS